MNQRPPQPSIPMRALDMPTLAPWELEANLGYLIWFHRGNVEAMAENAAEMVEFAIHPEDQARFQFLYFVVTSLFCGGTP
jgi:hypothetical protein